MSDREVQLEALSILCNAQSCCWVKHSLSRHSLAWGGGLVIIYEEEIFDPKYDYDFTDLEDTETYYRGG